MAGTVALAVCAALILACARADVNVMKDVTLGFGAALEYCREESGLTEEKMEDFFHFWRDDFEFKDRELGCAVQCMSKRFNLLTDSQRMHHENTENFIKFFPNGEVLAKRIVAIIHECEQYHDEQEDHCWRILRIAECFKNTCKRQDIAPTVELLLVELIMESEP